MAYPKYQNGTTAFSKDPKHFICHICQSTIFQRQQSLEDHLKDDLHCQMYAYFARFFEDKDNSNICKTCTKWISLDMAIDHANSHELLPLYLCEFELLFKHYISFRHNHYYCQLCNVKLLHWFSVIDHIEDVDHVCNGKDTINEAVTANLEFSLADYKYAVQHFIFMNEQTLSCFLCKCEIQGTMEEFIIHVMSDMHLKKEYEFDNRVMLERDGLDANVSCTKVENKPEINGELWESIINNLNTISSTIEKWSLIPTGGMIEHTNGSIQQTNSQTYCQPKMNITNVNFQSTITPTVPVSKPIQLNSRKTELPHGIETIVGTPHLLCTICSCRISGPILIQQHVNGIRHRIQSAARLRSS